MSETPPAAASLGRTLLVLGRVSNLPTVWSNCIAGWWLGGGGDLPPLPPLLAGASLLYVGGMYLNDAFDVDFDRQHRLERPIPSGRISRVAVAWLGSLCMVLGLACIVSGGRVPAALGVLLVGAIVVYDALHKLITFSPVLMALCRLLLLLLAASFGQVGVTGLAIWSSLVLAGYIIGLSYLARRESTMGAYGFWPLAPLVAPLVLAWVVNIGEFRDKSVAFSLLLALWMAKCLVPLWRQERGANVGRAVAGLLAGICLVDLLSVTDASRPLACVFLGCFGLALILQRYVPAT
jgi:4-hydroxybenzoate polyprenyltransferase